MPFVPVVDWRVVRRLHEERDPELDSYGTEQSWRPLPRIQALVSQLSIVLIIISFILSSF